MANDRHGDKKPRRAEPSDQPQQPVKEQGTSQPTRAPGTRKPSKAPGKKTRSEQLPMRSGGQPAAASGGAGAHAPRSSEPPRSLAEWTKDPWLNAAHGYTEGVKNAGTVQAKPAPAPAAPAQAKPELVLPEVDTGETAERDTSAGPGAQEPAERPLLVIPPVPSDATAEDVGAIRARVEEMRERAPDGARFVPARAQGQKQAGWPMLDGLDPTRMASGVKLTESVGFTEIRVGSEWVRLRGNPQDENGRYAYTIYEQDDGQAATAPTFAVHVVAAPGVQIDSTAGRLAHASALELHTARVQDPAGVPPQGTRFRAEYFQSTTVFAPEATGPLGLQPPGSGPGVTVHTGTSSATLDAELDAVPGHTGERQRLSLTLNAPELMRDARFAYQIVQDETGAVSEIRVVAGPAVEVSLVRPSARAWHRPRLHLFRVDDPRLVPAQGSPLDPSFFAARGRPLEPDREQVARNPREAAQRAAVDITLSAVPIVGALADLGELALAAITGHDRWGREVQPWELAVLGVAAFLPVVGGTALRSADDVARTLGRAADDIAPIYVRISAIVITQIRAS